MAGLSEEARAKLRKVSTATLTTCLLRRGFRTRMMTDVRSAGPANRMVGEAYTLRFIPAREDIDQMSNYADPANLHRRAIEECPRGHVLVIDARKDARASSGGDIMVARLKARGCAGIVTDGGFRDTEGVVATGLPAFHKQPAAPSTPILHHPQDLNVPIACGDVAVYPGDIVVGDSDGVVVIPAAHAEEIANEAWEMTQYEIYAETRIAGGASLYDVYPATPLSRADFEKLRNGKP
jgi:regulator of RNase E activity RraA